jgi:periplasmic nitrate reductase NapD
MMDPFLSRRDVLRGRSAPPSTEEHISSLVVHVRPEAVAAVRSSLAAMDGVDVHAESGGKLIITIETSTESGIVTRLSEISVLPGVLSALLVFHHIETADRNEKD